MLFQMLFGRRHKLDSGKLISNATVNGKHIIYSGNVAFYPRFSNREMMSPTRPRWTRVGVKINAQLPQFFVDASRDSLGRHRALRQ